MRLWAICVSSQAASPISRAEAGGGLSLSSSAGWEEAYHPAGLASARQPPGLTPSLADGPFPVLSLQLPALWLQSGDKSSHAASREAQARIFWEVLSPLQGPQAFLGLAGRPQTCLSAGRRDLPYLVLDGPVIKDEEVSRGYVWAGQRAVTCPAPEPPPGLRGRLQPLSTGHLLLHN